MITENERRFYDNINSVSKSLEKIAVQLTNRDAEECEKRARLTADLQQNHIAHLKSIMKDNEIFLCESCEERQVEIRGENCDRCQ